MTPICIQVSIPLFLRQVESYLDAAHFGNKSFTLKISPRHVVDSGTDESEDLVFASIFSHKGCRQAKATTRLNLRRETENRSGQHVHFVVDDESPVMIGEEIKMGEVFGF